jgi:hypothetical protein
MSELDAPDYHVLATYIVNKNETRASIISENFLCFPLGLKERPLVYGQTDLVNTTQNFDC